MASGTRNARSEKTVNQKSTEGIIRNMDDLHDADQETKAAYLKRMKAEDEANKKAFAKEQQWVEIHGPKVLHKLKNVSGSIYTRYLFSQKREPEMFAQLKKHGMTSINDASGKKLELELKHAGYRGE